MQTNTKKTTLYSARAGKVSPSFPQDMKEMLTIIRHNSHLSTKNMKRADECNTDKSDKLQESIVKLFRARVEGGDNVLGKHKTIWCGVSDDYEKARKYATYKIFRSRV